MPDIAFDAEISPRAFKVYAALCRYALLEPRVEVSARALAKRCKCGARVVNDALAELKEAGLIVRLPSRKGLPAIWRINRSPDEVEATLGREGMQDSAQGDAQDSAQGVCGIPRRIKEEEKNKDFSLKHECHLLVPEANDERAARPGFDSHPQGRESTREKKSKASIRGKDEKQKPETEPKSEKSLICDLTDEDRARVGMTP